MKIIKLLLTLLFFTNNSKIFSMEHPDSSQLISSKKGKYVFEYNYELQDRIYILKSNLLCALESGKKEQISKVLKKIEQWASTSTLIKQEIYLKFVSEISNKEKIKILKEKIKILNEICKKLSKKYTATTFIPMILKGTKDAIQGAIAMFNEYNNGKLQELYSEEIEQLFIPKKSEVI